MAYYFANDLGYKNYAMQAVIIRNKSIKYSVLFAQNIENADIVSLQNIVLDSKNIKYICRFVCNVEGADKKKAEIMILADKNAKGACALIKHAGSDPNNFKKIIMDSKAPRYLYELAKHLKGKKDLKKIEELIIESKSPTYIRLFAKNFSEANIEKLEQAMLDSENIKEIKKFALQVKNSKMSNFIIAF